MTRPSTGPTPADAPASLAALHAQAFPMLSPAQVAKVFDGVTPKDLQLV